MVWLYEDNRLVGTFPTAHHALEYALSMEYTELYIFPV